MLKIIQPDLNSRNIKRYIHSAGFDSFNSNYLDYWLHPKSPYHAYGKSQILLAENEEIVLKRLEHILKEGKARAIGVSNFTIRHMTELLETTSTNLHLLGFIQSEQTPLLRVKKVISAMLYKVTIKILDSCSLILLRMKNIPSLLKRLIPLKIEKWNLATIPIVNRFY